jgi:hypothetical protein
MRNKKAPVRRRLPVKAPAGTDDAAADLDDLDDAGEVPVAAAADSTTPAEAVAPAGRGGVVRRRPQTAGSAEAPAESPAGSEGGAGPAA